jgi:hypothetical protein
MNKTNVPKRNEPQPRHHNDGVVEPPAVIRVSENDTSTTVVFQANVPYYERLD